MKNRLTPAMSGITQSLGAATLPIEKAIAQSTRGNEPIKEVDISVAQAKLCGDEDCPYCKCQEGS